MNSLKQLSKEDKENILLLLHNYCISNNNDNLKLVDFDKFVDKYSVVDDKQIEINNLNNKITKLNNDKKLWNKMSTNFKDKFTNNNILDEDSYNRRFYNIKHVIFSGRTGKEEIDRIDNKLKEYNNKLEQYKNTLN